MNARPFTIVTTTAGATSIRDDATGEIMHNPVGPWVEANALYVEQSRLDDLLREDTQRELVVFDVGLGAAANALAVLHRARAAGVRRPLRLISFERDLRLLEFALVHADVFAHFAGYEPAVRELLDHGVWTEANVRWDLRHGDFKDLVARETARAHVIYFDPYSPKKNADMWSVDTFANLRRACDDAGATLYTYSRATPVRVALLLAGFYIGAGVGSGLKDETTQASTHLNRLPRPIERTWLTRWARSDAALPPAATAGLNEVEAVGRALRAHPQWAGEPVPPDRPT